MQTHDSFFFLLSLLLLLSRADALFGHAVIRCLFTSPHDTVYIAQLYFNKVLVAQYNSTEEKYVGFTEKTREIADDLNKNKEFLKQERKNYRICSNYSALAFQLQSPVEPTVRVRLVGAAESRLPGMLLCSAYDFYPKHIKLTWLRNGQEVKAGVTSTEELSNGNWLYQIHSYLEHTPSPGENITCMVEHASLMLPKYYEWDPRNESDRNKIAVGTAGLVLGLVIFVTGLIYYFKNATRRILVPTGQGSRTHSRNI